MPRAIVRLVPVHSPWQIRFWHPTAHCSPLWLAIPRGAGQRGRWSLLRVALREALGLLTAGFRRRTWGQEKRSQQQSRPA
eukprot:6782224-Alexandrium_andersonii.AAC.1